MAPEVGFEPTTNRLTADRSTTELLRNSQRGVSEVKRKTRMCQGRWRRILVRFFIRAAQTSPRSRSGRRNVFRFPPHEASSPFRREKRVPRSSTRLPRKIFVLHRLAPDELKGISILASGRRKWCQIPWIRFRNGWMSQGGISGRDMLRVFAAGAHFAGQRGIPRALKLIA